MTQQEFFKYQKTAKTKKAKTNTTTTNAPASNAPNPFQQVLNVANLNQFFVGSNQFSHLSWGQSTTKNAISYTLRKLIPAMSAVCDENSGSFDDSDLITVKQRLLKKALNSKKSIGHHDTAEEGITSRLYRSAIVYDHLRNALVASGIDIQLPDLNFSAILIRKRLACAEETVKSIPQAVRQNLATTLIDDECQNPLTIGVAAMLCAGLRPSEVAGMNVGDLINRGNYYTYYVNKQFRNGQITFRLKSESAYRHVVLNFYFKHIFEKRLAILLKTHTAEEINNLPLVSTEDDPATRASGAMISAYAKNLLSNAGLSHDDWIAAKTSAMQENDAEGSVSGYVLRRDFATRAMFHCGIEIDDVFYLMGHSAVNDRRKDYFNPDVSQHLALQLERYVLHPQCSLNPTYSPITLSSQHRYTATVAFTQFGYQSETLTTNCQINSIEAGSSIQIVLPPGAHLENFQCIAQRMPAVTHTPLIHTEYKENL